MCQQGSIEIILRREVCEEFAVASNFGWNCEVLFSDFLLIISLPRLIEYGCASFSLPRTFERADAEVASTGGENSRPFFFAIMAFVKSAKTLCGRIKSA